MNYKTVSSEAIIAKIHRDLKPRDASWEIDAIEWIGEAMEFIGYFTGFELKEQVVRVSDHRAMLPPNLYELLGVRVGKYRIPCEDAMGSFDLGTVRDVIFKTTEFSGDYSFSQLTVIPNHYYYVQPNYLKTSFRNGGVRLQFLAFPVDCNGYPEVPDNIVVKQALEWYILRQMIMGGYEHKFIDWRTADENWKRYCVSAQNDLAFPSVDRMENFMDRWVRLIPDIQKPLDRRQEILESTNRDASHIGMPGIVKPITFKDNYWKTDNIHGGMAEFIEGFESNFDETEITG